MTDPVPPQGLTPSGNSKTVSSILAAMVSSYFMTQLSLHGVDFETMGISSEIVKSFFIGSLVGFFAWVTPKNLVSAVRDVILFWRDSWKSWRDAANEGKE